MIEKQIHADNVNTTRYSNDDGTSSCACCLGIEYKDKGLVACIIRHHFYLKNVALLLLHTLLHSHCISLCTAIASPYDEYSGYPNQFSYPDIMSGYASFYAQTIGILYPDKLSG